MKKPKCGICKEKFGTDEDLILHIEEEHESLIPQGWETSRYLYSLRTGKTEGRCVQCKNPTEWKSATNKYHRFCKSDKCKAEYIKIAKGRMIAKHGKESLLNDPKHQIKMLANRKISGKYKWEDGGETGYTGSYELELLRVLDVVFNFSSDDVIQPSPHTYYYKYDDKECFYIPDFFIPSLNLEMEIKDGGDNPNNHHKIQAVDKKKEQLKDEVMLSQKNISYIKIVDKKYDNLFDFFNRAKENYQNGISKPIFIL